MFYPSLQRQLKNLKPAKLGVKKVALEIVGLSYSQTQTGAYALVLGETEGKRRLPIIIGGFEAQAIAIEMEKMKPSRPLTHDLFKNFARSFEIDLSEIIIYNLVEGIFYSKLVCEKNGETIEIDTRTSDAVALALRFNCPIYTHEFILSSAGIILDDQDNEIIAKESSVEEAKVEKTKAPVTKELSLKELQAHLDKAIAREDYEKASKIRDEINKRKDD